MVEQYPLKVMVGGSNPPRLTNKEISGGVSVPPERWKNTICLMSLSFQTPSSEGENKKLRKEFTIRLSERLREVRKSKKLTQQELAERAGLHLTYVGHLELGKYQPNSLCDVEDCQSSQSKSC